jgi:ATP-dependent Lhr-like helicase
VKLLQEVALVELWEQGFVEPIVPPPEPYHILSQQLMALALQQSGIGRNEWFQWVQGVYGYSQFPAESVAELESWMLEKEILSDSEGLLWLGTRGEARFGRKNFMELFSVFTSPPIFHVLHGRSEIGQVDESALLIKQDGPRLLSLGGRTWEVQHVDWQRKHAYVQPSELMTRTKWPGDGIGLSFRICQMMREILCSSRVSEKWSERCKTQLDNLRNEFNWIHSDGLTMINEEHERLALWTFAGARANSIVAYHLAQEIKSQVLYDGFKLRFDKSIRDGEIRSGLQRLSEKGVLELRPIANEHALRGLKFSECLPPRLAEIVSSARLRDDQGVDHILRSTVHSVVTTNPERVGKSLGSRRSYLAGPRGSSSSDSNESEE